MSMSRSLSYNVDNAAPRARVMCVWGCGMVCVRARRWVRAWGGWCFGWGFGLRVG